MYSAHVSRRRFLSQSGALALSPALLSACNGSDDLNADDAIPIRAWNELAERLKGSVVLPDDASFSALALPRNITYADVRPQGIAMVTSAQDVSEAVLWAQEWGIQPTVRSPSGHSYAGYSVTTGLSIDTSRLSKTCFDGNLAKVQAGAMLGNVIHELAPSGVILPVGRCPTVGVSGLTLAGGFGFNSRQYGLTCDHLVETEIVTADGEILTCNESEHSDVFWALRGGNGGTFGINTKYVFRTHAGRGAGVYSLKWSAAANQPGEIERVARAYSELSQLAENAPNAFSMRLGISVSGSRQISVTALGQYIGDEDDPIGETAVEQLEELLAPALQLNPRSAELRGLDFFSAANYLSVLGSPNPFQSKSGFLNRGLDDAGIEKLILWLLEWPTTGSSGEFVSFLWGGKILEPAPDAMAFMHRTGQWVIEGSSGWYPGASAQAISDAKMWIEDGFEDSLKSYFNGSAFQNFMDRTQSNWEQAYYGDNFERLTEIKRKYDPFNVFFNDQSIPPA